MENDFPKAGQVFDYHYLWKWQDARGETEGRKIRPCCMALVVVNEQGKHLLFIAAITSKTPEASRVGVKIPETEAHRAHLDTHILLWIMIDELNVDILESSYTLEARTPRGQFSHAFTGTVIRKLQGIRKRKNLRITTRS